MGPTARPTENNVFPASYMPLANAVYSTVFWPTCRPFCSPEYIVPPSVCLCIYYNDAKMVAVFQGLRHVFMIDWMLHFSHYTFVVAFASSATTLAVSAASCVC